MKKFAPLFRIGLLAGFGVISLVTTSAMAAGDPIAGKKSFLQCQMCHTVDVGGRSGIGPNLAGVVGKKAASRIDFKYSDALTKAQFIWKPATLDAWLKKPAAAVPGTKMVYGGMGDATMRANVIAYLGTLKGK